MKELAEPDGKYKDTIQKLPLLFNAIQWQQHNVGWVPNSEKDAGWYWSKCNEVLWMTKGHCYIYMTQYGHPKPLKLRNPQLVLPLSCAKPVVYTSRHQHSHYLTANWPG